MTKPLEGSAPQIARITGARAGNTARNRWGGMSLGVQGVLHATGKLGWLTRTAATPLRARETAGSGTSWAQDGQAEHDSRGPSNEESLAAQLARHSPGYPLVPFQTGSTVLRWPWIRPAVQRAGRSCRDGAALGPPRTERWRRLEGHLPHSERVYPPVETGSITPARPEIFCNQLVLLPGVV